MDGANNPPSPLRQRRTQADRSEETRGKLLEAALKVLREQGYSDLSIAEVAKEAELSRGALMHHYPTKDDLIFKTLEYAHVELLERTRARTAQLPAGADPIEALITDSKDFFFGHLFLILVAVQDATKNNPKLSKKLKALARKFRFPIEWAWEEVLVNHGLPADLAEDVVWLTLSIVRGLAMRTLFQDDPARFERLYDLWREIFWGYWAARQAEKAAAPAAPSKRRRKT